MTSKKFIAVKAIANIISGLSMVTLIGLGVAYMSFDNAFVFQDIKIEITNNPVTEDRDIEFMMIGSKKHECASTKVYGSAYDKKDNKIILDRFTKQYVRNTTPGDSVPNQWSLGMPKEMEKGEYRLSMTGEFICNYLIFQKEKTQTYDNILLIVE